MVSRMTKSNDKTTTNLKDEKDKIVLTREIEEMKISVQQNEPIDIVLIFCGFKKVISPFHSYLNSLILMSSSQVNMHLVTDGLFVRNYLQKIVSI